MLWRHVQRYAHARTKARHLFILASGKSGVRWLISKHGATVVFEHLAVVSSLVFLPIQKNNLQATINLESV